jgi:HSP20 family protein
MSNVTRRSQFPGFEAFPSTGLSLLEDTLSRFFNEPVAGRPWCPAVDICENENALVLSADIPGVKMEDIEIKIEQGTLTLSGSREFKKQDEKGGYHRLERSYGSFHRAFSLPDTVEADKVEASFDNGVLTITLPKKELAKPRTIKVAVGKHS